MRHHKSTFKVGRTSAHIRSLLSNAVCSLIEHGRITTTLVKAKRIRVVAEKMVTLGKKGDLHHRRQAYAFLHATEAVGKLFEEIAPGFKDRNGGYTRIMKIGPRIGDAAEMAIVEFVEDDSTLAARKAAPEAEAAAPAEQAEAAAPAEAPAAEAPAAEAEDK